MTLSEMQYVRKHSTVPTITTKKERVIRTNPDKQSAELLEKAKKIYMGILIKDLLDDNYDED